MAEVIHELATAHGVNLRGVNLRGVNLRGVNLRGVDLAHRNRDREKVTR